MTYWSRACAMKADAFDCHAALNDDTQFKDDVWAYCSGVFGEAQWQGLVDAKLAQGWADLEQSEAAARAADDAQRRGYTDMGKRAADVR
jgi:hypothetical protein